MRQSLHAALVALALLLVLAPAFAQQLQGLEVASETAKGLTTVPRPTSISVSDRPGDAGTALLLQFKLEPLPNQVLYVSPQVQIDGRWVRASKAPLALDTVQTCGDLPNLFGIHPPDPDCRVIVIEGYFGAEATPPQDLEGSAASGEATGEPGATASTAGGEASDDTAEAEAADSTGGEVPAAEEETSAAVPAADDEPTPLVPGTEYPVQLSIFAAAGQQNVPAGTATPRENLFASQRLNVLLISFLFAAIILVTIYRARMNPGSLFIRRIAGLEAVEEAIGRATEMGKPVMQVNGLDPLTTPSTIAAVNILGQIARKVAHYDSRLMVPSFDPVVMTVSQETVKQAYMAEGRPDAYREDDIFFVTDQQFSYVASVCGLMLRERPAANFFLGYFYAESLLLAETGQSTGAIQIAGTDAQAQLPFFITTCDYTLIGEELYAASAYLSREPMLLAGLKGLDFSKIIIMLLILFGSVLATFGITFLTELFTPLG